MECKGILKTISIKNNDTDTYITIKLELDNNNIDINKLYNYKHKILNILIEDIE